MIAALLVVAFVLLCYIAAQVGFAEWTLVSAHKHRAGATLLKVRHGRRVMWFYGECTVWHSWPDCRRACTFTESRLCELHEYAKQHRMIRELQDTDECPNWKKD